MQLSKKFKITVAVILVVLASVILAGYISLQAAARDFNNTLRLSTDGVYNCYVNIAPRGDSTTSWQKESLCDKYGKPMTGVVYDAEFLNASGIEVRDWTMQLNIHQDCYLNNAWCGLLEIHQVSEDRVQTLDLRDYSVDDITLKFILDGPDLLIPLTEGDYIIYYPNSEVNEAPIAGAEGGTTSMVFGLILYNGSDGLDLTDNPVSFYLNREALNDSQVVMFVALIFAFIVILIAFVTLLVYSGLAAKRMNEQEAIVTSALAVFSGFVDAKDPYTNGHSERVGKYTALLSEKLGLSSTQCRQNYYIGLMHDCGKCFIPDAILKKPGRLSEEEFEIIKTHTKRGAELLEDFDAIEGIREGALCHHERYDGTGYPEGRKGEHIPLIGRIICVADAFDAMNSQRLYRNRLEPSTILEELKNNSGTQFDPKVVEAMLELCEEGRIDGFYV